MSNTGRPSSDSSSSAAGGASAVPRPAPAQWYHEYGEDGVGATVKRYTAAYDKAASTPTGRRWT